MSFLRLGNTKTTTSVFLAQSLESQALGEVSSVLGGSSGNLQRNLHEEMSTSAPKWVALQVHM